MSELDEWVEVTTTEPLSGRYTAAVRKSVELAEHLEPTDDADVQLAYGYAKVIDTAFDENDAEKIHRVSCVAMPSLHKTLTDLGLNPRGRRELGLDADDDDDDW